jgi:hypothetical protein
MLDPRQGFLANMAYFLRLDCLSASKEKNRPLVLFWEESEK